MSLSETGTRQLGNQRGSELLGGGGGGALSSSSPLSISMAAVALALAAADVVSEGSFAVVVGCDGLGLP